MSQRQRRIKIGINGIIGSLFVVLMTMQCHQAKPPLTSPEVTDTQASQSHAASLASLRRTKLAEPVSPASDPLAFAQHCLKKYRENPRDYRCTFTRQEWLDDELKPEQQAEVRFRPEPFSVDMLFTHNVRNCARALYVKDKWNDDQGNAQAWVKPGGAILRALVPKIKQPIHGSRAKKEGRRSIDQFGFEQTLNLIVKYSEAAKKEGKLDLRYVGTGKVDDRPTYVFERRLPYTGEEKPYPDRLLVYHIDQQHLVPTACYSYADDEGEKLLGKYIYTNIDFGRDYTDADFDPEQIEF